MKLILFTVHALFSIVLTKNIQNARQGRIWWGTRTETKVQTDVVTALVPSSCVHVEPSLPPCRSVRNLDPFPEFVGMQFSSNHGKGRQLQPQNAQEMVPASANSSSVGWAEYLGFVAPTVTITAIELKTSTVVDPRTVVTFSVKGCRPSRLPLDLDRCPIPLQVISPSTVSNTIEPSARNIDFGDIEKKYAHTKKFKSVQIEPSAELIEENWSAVPTEDLSNVEMTE